MRLVVISDTHGRHEDLGTLEGDVLVHCGDFLDGLNRDESALDAVDGWFAEQRFELVLCVGGNHDFAVEKRVRAGEPVLRHAEWLQDRTLVHRGVRFFGAPWVPHLEGWAFYMDPDGLRQKWAGIPGDTDVLISHTPPHGILDRPQRAARSCGCPHLLERVETVRPRYHVFGHIHSNAGVETVGETTFVNAAVVDGGLDVVRGAVTFDIEPRTPNFS